MEVVGAYNLDIQDIRRGALDTEIELNGDPVGGDDVQEVHG
jgi:hypothetical protein